MYQRKANMKPAALSDDVRVSLGSLMEFILSCELALKARGEEDEAFRFECIREYLKNDYTPSKGLHFKPGVIGL
jgi:hypothetical protein